jgi:hypothetical protein
VVVLVLPVVLVEWLPVPVVPVVPVVVVPMTPVVDEPLSPLQPTTHIEIAVSETARPIRLQLMVVPPSIGPATYLSSLGQGWLAIHADGGFAATLHRAQIKTPPRLLGTTGFFDSAF